MYEVTTTITVNDATEHEVCVLPIETQEELIEFYVDYLSMELDRLYGELRVFNGRTFAAVEPSHRRSLTRRITGTSRRDGCEPIDGTVSIIARRVA